MKRARNSGKTFRVLSLDGGGIYGMFTDLMLKDLTERNAGFLKDGSVNLFAGTSAGAVNSLLLAMHQTPADGLAAAIEFWGEPGVYDNSDPMQLWVTSLMGYSPYFGTEDYKAVLVKYFGERTLGDLRHPVLVVTWDWAGNPGPANQRHWRPKIYCNFPDDNPDRAASLVDVAFKAGAPSWFRCIYGGGQDGGLIAPNPALYAITKVIDTLSHARHCPQTLPDGFRVFAEGMSRNGHAHHRLREVMSVFSLGVGAQQPFLPISYANWGMQGWMTGMWNPYMQRWVSPMTSISLDGPTEAVDTQCALLLNNVPGQPDGYFRLNPQVLETPVMDVLMRLRANPYYLEYTKKTIQSAIGKPAAREALRRADLWLDQAGWCRIGGETR